MPTEISRAAYADMYGPTTGDKVRLADTELFIEVEEDRTTYGNEVKFGGGKVIRDGMGQSQVSRADGAMDTVNLGVSEAQLDQLRAAFCVGAPKPFSGGYLSTTAMNDLRKLLYMYE